MKALKAKFASYSKDESGATMIEYALIAALISIAAIAVLPLLGNEIRATFGTVRNSVRQGRVAAM